MNKQNNDDLYQAGPSSSASCSFSESKSSNNKKDQKNLLDLPRELIDKILFEIALVDYGSLYMLARSCHAMKNICDAFMTRFPMSKFKPMIPAGEESEEEWNYDNSSDDCREYDPDDLDDLNDMLERFSYGSDYDEDLDELLNGPGDDNYAANDGAGDGAALVGDELNLDNGNVTEGW